MGKSWSAVRPGADRLSYLSLPIDRYDETPLMAAARKPKPKQIRRYDAESKAAFRQTVVQIARELFADAGYASVSMRGIATKAGCTPMALYGYFPSKLALLRFIWADIFREVFSRTERAMTTRTSAKDKLRAYWTHWGSYWLRHPDNYRVVFMNQDMQSDTTDPALEGMDGQFFANGKLATQHLDKLAEVFRAGMAAGDFRRISVPLCVQVFSTQMIGVVHSLVTMPDFDWGDPEETAQAALDASILGLLAPSVAAKSSAGVNRSSRSQ